MKEKLQVHWQGCCKESVVLAFWKLNLAAIHEWGKWMHNHFQCLLGLREGRRPYGTIILVTWLKYLGCHMIKDKGTHMDNNSSNIVIVYPVVVVMLKIVHRQV